MKKHGMSGNSLYILWQGIKTRCYNRNYINYKNYGGRGIIVYKEWCDNFHAFCNYVSRLPHFKEPGYTLDRINPNGNFEPNNVKWVTRAEQYHNYQQAFVPARKKFKLIKKYSDVKGGWDEDAV